MSCLVRRLLFSFLDMYMSFNARESEILRFVEHKHESPKECDVLYLEIILLVNFSLVKALSTN